MAGENGMRCLHATALLNSFNEAPANGRGKPPLSPAQGNHMPMLQ